MAEPAPLIVFADDWGRHPSSCQHLVKQLLPRRRVTWVNTIGMRPPRFNWSTVTRGVEKIKSWFIPIGGRQTHESGMHGGLTPPDRPNVLNPKMWPSFHSRFARGLNRRLLARAVRPVAEAMPQPPIVVTTLPLVADLVGTFPAARWVYYCVDDFGVWPGLDGRTLQNMEIELVAKVDSVIAVSETLQAHIAKLGKPSKLLTHGVDLDHFRSPTRKQGSGFILFWGVIDRRMDVSFLRRLAERTDVPIRLVGPQDNPDPEVFKLPRVEVKPAISYEELPALAAEAGVLVMPYADLPVTRAMQPLKLKEYLATGKPVVVRKLPSTESWADCCDVCDSPEAFAEAVLRRLREGVPSSQNAARGRLDSESWTAKARQFEEWLG